MRASYTHMTGAVLGALALSCLLSGCLRSERECESSSTCDDGDICVEGLCQSVVASGEDASRDASRDASHDADDADMGGADVGCEGDLVSCATGCCNVPPVVGAGVLDVSGDVGFEPSIAIDGSGYPHIAYQDVSNKKLRYIRWTGDAWEEEALDGREPFETSGFLVHLIVSASGQPLIMHRTQTLEADQVVASRVSGGVWSHDLIAEAEGVLSMHACGRDPDEVGVAFARLSDQSDAPSELMYATNRSGGWVVDETIEPLGDVEHVSCATRGDGRPRILHKSKNVNGFDGGLYDVRRSGIGWPRTRAFVGSDTLGAVSDVEFDAQDKAHAVLWDPGVGELVYATSESSDWFAEAAISTGVDISEFELALDADGRPRVVLVIGDGPIGELKYTVLDADGRWSSRTLESFGRPSYPTLALDAYGRTHVAYYDSVDRNLVYTYFDGSDWVVDTL